MPILIFSNNGNFSYDSVALQDLHRRYRSLRISLRKEYIYLVFQETQDLEMFNEDIQQGKLPQLTQETFEVLGNLEDQPFINDKTASLHLSEHQTQPAQKPKLQINTTPHQNSKTKQEVQANGLAFKRNEGTQLSSMVIEQNEEREKMENYSTVKQQDTDQQFIPMVEEPTQQLQLYFQAEQAIVLEIPKQQTKQTKEQATNQSLISEKQGQPQPEIKTALTQQQHTQRVHLQPTHLEEYIEGSFTETSKITSQTQLNDMVVVTKEIQKGQNSATCVERQSSALQARLEEDEEKQIPIQSFIQEKRNGISFRSKSAYVFAVLTVWILWIVY